MPTSEKFRVGDHPNYHNPGIPWALIEPHEAQAQRNHYQSLAQLHDRGGLAWCEALAVLEDRKWTADPNAKQKVLALVAKHEASGFQARATAWCLECLGRDIAVDTHERNLRFLEEAVELVQACHGTAETAHKIVDYVFGRSIGEKRQETGGVLVCLAALCSAHGFDMAAAGEEELKRIGGMMDAIRRKHAAKPRFSDA